MRVVAENSEVDMAKRQARDDLEWPMVQLAANMLRVVRGAGEPQSLPRQMVSVIKAVSAYHDVFGFYPSADELSAPINVRLMLERRDTDGWSGGVDKIVQGALQVAASQIVGQATQESLGEREIMDGMRRIEVWREGLRQESRSKRRT